MVITLTSDELFALVRGPSLRLYGDDPIPVPIPPVGPPPPPIDPCEACDPCKDAPAFALTYCEDGRTHYVMPPTGLGMVYPVFDPALPGWLFEQL